MSETPTTDEGPGVLEHFRLHVLAAVAQVVETAGRALGSHEGLLEQFPFLSGYLDELDELGALPADGSPIDWATTLGVFQQSLGSHLPLRAFVAQAELDFPAVMLWLASGLLEEDGRFGGLFEALQPGLAQQRPTPSLLQSFWSQEVEDGGVQRRLRRLRELGVLEVVNPEAPRNLWALQVPAAVWDALRGEPLRNPAPFLRHVPASELADGEPPVLEAATLATASGLSALFTSKQLDAVVVRGPHHNGRRTLLRWLARELGRGVLEIELSGKPDVDSARLRSAAPLATLLGALPVLVAELGPGETLELPDRTELGAPLGVVLGRCGGIRGPALERAITLNLELPPVALRERHLARALREEPDDLALLAGRFRMTSGNLRRVGSLASAQAKLAGRDRVTAADLREAARAFGRQALDTLATRLADAGDWNDFSASSETLRELRTLEFRCRNRERLGAGVGEALARGLNVGVRALFQGPSGTGKTLAARLVAAALGKELYRVDLSAVVNKYIGETEKNLARVFAVAEELDIVLLFDEGDALLTRRTGVTSSNDRYANLETNFLLQRMESFEGIVIVTTNAGELIDGAFQRRMDVIVDFRPPDPIERWSLWQLHLPPAHDIDPALLHEVTTRCQFTGGQIRNAVLHASLLALADGGAMHSEHLEGAIRREYRKSGGVCPLRQHAVGHA
ncbi:MAG TPA: ATP-binding protein [Polyangiaceae bacterium]